MRIRKVSLNALRSGITASIALAVATPLVAQRQHAPPGAQAHEMAAMHCGGGMSGMADMPAHAGRAMSGARMEGMMHGMDMMGPPPPAMVLRYKEQLELSSAQVTRLETLQKQAEPGCRQQMQLGMAAHQAANQLLETGAPDFAAYQAKLTEATAHMVQGHVMMAKAAVAARGVLTAAQRQTLKSLMQPMPRKG